MNGESITKELRRVLLRSRAGLITAEQAQRETALLTAMLKAYEQTELERKLDHVRAVLDSRRS